MGNWRAEVLRDLDQKRLATEAAAQLQGLEHHQVFRLLKACWTEGPAVLISLRRDRQHRLQPSIGKPPMQVSGPVCNM
jgi:hypothetical protein